MEKFEWQNASTCSNSPISELEDNLCAPIELFDDNILGDEFKKEVVIPYFKCIYKDLTLRSDDRKMGISKHTFLNVSTNSSICDLNEASTPLATNRSTRESADSSTCIVTSLFQ